MTFGLDSSHAGSTWYYLGQVRRSSHMSSSWSHGVAKRFRVRMRTLISAVLCIADVSKSWLTDRWLGMLGLNFFLPFQYWIFDLRAVVYILSVVISSKNYSGYRARPYTQHWKLKKLNIHSKQSAIHSIRYWFDPALYHLILWSFNYQIGWSITGWKTSGKRPPESGEVTGHNLGSVRLCIGSIKCDYLLMLN